MVATQAFFWRKEMYLILCKRVLIFKSELMGSN